MNAVEATFRMLSVLTAGAELRTVLDEHNRLMESVLQGVTCAVFIVEGEMLELASAPSLPEAFHAAADELVGVQGGPSSCAAATRDRVIVADFAEDTRWEAASAVAMRYDVRACWATPILCGDELVGVFTVYCHSPRVPTPSEQELLDVGAELVRLAVHRIREEAALRESEARTRVSSARLRAVVDGSPLAICEVSPEGEIRLWNRAAERIFGWSGHDVIGGTSPAVPADRREEYETLLARADAGSEVVDYETVRRASDGRLIEVSVSLAPIRDERGEISGVTSIAVDISKRKALERRLLQTQKIEALGQLASGVAHDFNNVLMVIGGEAELAIADIDSHHPARARVERVREAASRGGDLTKRLLTFSRITTNDKSPLDVNDVVRDAMTMLERLLPASIETTLDLARALPPVLGARTELEQVLLNLALNARDAMPAGGTLTVTTRLVHNEVQLAVADSGVGIDEETRDQILEPFFTTKLEGEGTGLGLAIVAEVLERHHGRLTIETCRGAGSTFVVWLPAVVPLALAGAA